MKYYVIVESDLELEGVDTDSIIDPNSVEIDHTIHKFPAEMPISSSYDFQSYHNGYAKGYNDCLKTLLGEKLGEYDPEKDKVEEK